jgi:hypothetical protein
MNLQTIMAGPSRGGQTIETAVVESVLNWSFEHGWDLRYKSVHGPRIVFL